MPDKHTTGDARRGVVLLSEYLQQQYLQCTRPRCRQWHAAQRPIDAREGDMFVCAEVTDGAPLAGTGIERGDFLIFIVTSEVEAGDLIVLRWRGLAYTGFLEIEADGRWLLTDADGEPRHGYFEPEPSRVVGRCVEVQRRGRRVRILRVLRPMHADLQAT